MIKRTPTYDVKCADLSEHFLEDEGALDTPANVAELAAEIQNTIENFIDRKRSDLEPRVTIPGET